MTVVVPDFKNRPRPNVITNAQFISQGNSVHPSARSVIVIGSGNDIGIGCSAVSLLACMNCTIAAGIKNVTAINCTSITIDVSNTIFINNIEVKP